MRRKEIACVCVCVWLVEEKEEEEIRQAAQPEEESRSSGRERRESWPNWEERERDWPIGTGKGGKEGESGAGDRPDPLDPFLTRSAPIPNFDDFHPSFWRIASRNLMGNTLELFLYPFHLQFGDIYFWKWRKPQEKGAVALASNHPIPKQFLSIATTHGILLRPIIKPKHWLGRRSWFEDGLSTPISRVLGGFDKIEGFPVQIGLSWRYESCSTHWDI